MKEGLEVKGRRAIVVDRQGTRHFLARDTDFVRQETLGTVLFGLGDTPRIVVSHAVRHVRPIQRVLASSGSGFVVLGFQFPFVETRESLENG